MSSEEATRPDRAQSKKAGAAKPPRARRAASGTPRTGVKKRAVVEERPYHHGNLRRTLLDGAMGLFVERGFDFTFRELARVAGVTHNAPYRHFASKAELLGALRAEGQALLVAAERSALAGCGADPAARVRVLGEVYVRFAMKHPHHFRLVLSLSEDASKGAGSAKRRPPEESFQLLEEALEAARVAGVARADRSAKELAVAAWALVHGFATLLVGGQLPSSEAAVRRYVEIGSEVFLDGVRPR